MRLLTYNIHYWAGLDGEINVDRVREVIRMTGADVVGLNEVLHPLITPEGLRYPLIELAQSLGMYWAFGPSFQQTASRFWPGTLGNAVLSRFPIFSQQNTRLRLVPTRKQRTLFRVRLNVHGYTMSVFVTHLDHLLAPVRRMQFETAIRVLQRTHEPHILMGDFNTHTPIHSRVWKGEQVIRRLRLLGYVDVYTRVGQGKGHSYPSSFPLARIDYMWVPAQWAWTLAQARVVDTPLTREASDHLPVCLHWHWDAIKTHAYRADDHPSVSVERLIASDMERHVMP